MTYRPDIDGLRAIAVLSVVIFHLGVPGFGGGFVGVDVFFVISGYLITSIITADLGQGRFSLKAFYTRRIRRLVPALIATVVFTSAGAALLMTPDGLISYGRSAVAALFSLSNFVFYFESGYWDTDAELKPLLHTWSLGVEEQFYLFWPALVMLLFSLRHRIPMAMAWLSISVAGAALCAWYTIIDRDAAFYLLPFRVFQFSFGALVISLAPMLFGAAGTQRLWARPLLFALGLFAVGFSVHGFGDGVHFPGWAVLLPTLGTSSLLLAGASANGLPAGLGWLVCNPASRWVGKVSYAMYLVHWPIIALYRYQYGNELGPRAQLLLGSLTLLLTVVLHYGIEMRFYRRSGHQAHRAVPYTGGRFAAVTFLVASLTAGVMATAWLGDGWSWRKPGLVLSAEAIEAGKQRRFEFTRQACNVLEYPSHENCDPGADIRILVLGDSHEPDGYNFLRGAFARYEGVNLVSFGTIKRCRDLAKKDGRFHAKWKSCLERVDRLLDATLLDSMDMVVYSANRPFSNISEPMIILLESIKALRPELPLVAISGYLVTERECAWLINQSGSAAACSDPGNLKYFGATPEQSEQFARLDPLIDLFIDRIDLLCEDRDSSASCMTSTPAGVPAFYDKHHLTLEFAEMSGRLYERRFPGVLYRLAKDAELSD